MMKDFLGVCFVLVGLALVAYWVLFMSWSHSFLAPAFQRRQALLLGSAAIALVAGISLIVTAWVQRRGTEAQEPASGGDEPQDS